jgi:membrane protease YdiL (CAAX protease family)
VNERSQLRSVPWNIWQALLVFLLPWVVLPIALIVSLSFLAHSYPVAGQYLDQIDNGDVKANFSLVILDALASFGLIALFLRRYQLGWSALGLRRFNLRKALLYLVGLVVGFFLVIAAVDVLVQVLIPSYDPNQEQVNEFTDVAPNLKLYSLLALVILPPLVEEPVFRGFLFPAFSRRFGLVGGALISSLLFGFAHLQANVSVYTFVIGLLLCFLYARLGSIVHGIALHMFNNYLAYVAITQAK